VRREQLKGIVFDVQRFSVHDGPGIRTTVFFKGCPLRCPWCQNPESLRPNPEMAFYADRCHGSGSCFQACPCGALQRDGERIIRNLCDACGLCVPACPFGALQKVGRIVSIDELVQEVLSDRLFYKASGGGVTMSGGEPMFQKDFIAAFARRCKDEGIGVVLQTCGAFQWEQFKPLIPLFNLIQFDLKVINPGQHRAIIGAENEAILSNAKLLIEAAAPVEFRMPVVPGYTDTDVNLQDVAAFLKERGVKKIHLLPYHAMGEAKLPRLGFPIQPLPIHNKGWDPGLLNSAKVSLRAEGLEVIT